MGLILQQVPSSSRLLGGFRLHWFIHKEADLFSPPLSSSYGFWMNGFVRTSETHTNEAKLRFSTAEPPGIHFLSALRTPTGPSTPKKLTLDDLPESRKCLNSKLGEHSA